MDSIDKTGTLGVDVAPVGISNFSLMKADPVWAQLAGEVAALQVLVISLKAKYNALLAKLDANHAAATDHVATLAETHADPKL